MTLFPYPHIRSGQKEFLDDVEHAVKEGKHLVAHAPTGIGKTAAVLAPTVKHALATGRTIFFLTPKHTQHTLVVDTLQLMAAKHKLSIAVVDFIGKQWMCPHKVDDLDNREFNEFCRGMKKDEVCKYYNHLKTKGKLSDAAKEVIAEVRKTPLHNEKILQLCQSKNLCPYEICIEAAKKATVIVGDYFHLLSPPVRQAFLTKMEKSAADSIIILDEAHNLPERVRTLLSLSLSHHSIKNAINEANVLGNETLAEDLQTLLNLLKAMGKGMRSGDERYINRDEFADELEANTKLKYDDLVNSIDELGNSVLDIPKRYRSYAKSVAGFLDQWRGENLGYARILRREKRLSLSYQCLDPAFATAELLNSAHASILMSGTLTPLPMYTDVLGLMPARTLQRSYKSPFPVDNKLTIVVSNLTTKFSKRSEMMFTRYARIINSSIKLIPANIAVFSPSYSISHLLSEKIKQHKNLGKRVIEETQDMKKTQRRNLYKQLEGEKEKGGAVLCAVQAGSMSEGLDYADNLLDAVFIVGLPLEHPDLETKSLIEYYDFKFERGWDYGYIYPAMNRALQAAGRLIRSETDRGVILLMDERFSWANYAKCFPADFAYILTEQPQKYVERFFEKR